MARCCGDTCSCKIITVDDVHGNPLVTLTGTGSITDPFVFDVSALTVLDSDDIDLDLTWVAGVGYRLTASFAASSNLDSIGDVNAPAPSNGQVLGWDNATQKWTPRAPTTAATGGVDHGTTLTGDGSVGDPLDVSFDPAGQLTDTGDGARLTDAALNAMTFHYTDATSRAAATPAPQLGTTSTLDTDPGQLYWWDGSDWQPLIRLVDVDGVAYVESSGPYTDGPVTLWTRSLSVSTDADGLFEYMDAATLASFAGVLAVQVQSWINNPSTDTPWTAVLAGTTTSLQAYAYALDGSGPIGSNIVTVVVNAWVYN